MIWAEKDTTGWGRALRGKGLVARPDTRSDISASSGPAVGNRRSYGDAALNSGGQSMDMTRLDRIISLDRATGVIEVEAGVNLGTLARALPPLGWMPAVLPGTGFATVGGAIGMDVHGKNHHGAGTFGQHVSEITLLQGETRRTVTPEDTALWQATIGGLGQTGVILSAKLRLAPAKGRVMVVTEQRAPDWDSHLTLLDQSRASYVVGWIDATATGANLGRGIVEEAEVGPGLPPRTKSAKSVPLDAPGFALSPPIVRAFNAAYYARVPAHGRTVIRSMADFFFPLDAIHDWNRLYGKRGFHQFQCVVPADQTAALRAMLDDIAGSGLASPLAVLKKTGAGKAGYLSFPMAGYTLAVDFPNRPGAAALIRGLIAQTRAAGGRIYLAKDSLAAGDDIRAMYPDWALWRAEADRADPNRALETDMTRRLGLRQNRNAP